jgi:hypothetical protein
VGVIVSVGRGVDVTVSVGFGVNVRVGEGEIVSVEGMLVDGSAGMGEDEAVGFPLFALQAFVTKLIKTSTYKVFTFICLFY